MNPNHCRDLLWLVVGVLLAATAPGRVLSYSPLTDRPAFPATQFRSSRHFVMIESDGFVPLSNARRDRVVLYDSRGQSEPRVLLPIDGSSLAVFAAAVWEDAEEIPRILLSTDASLAGDNPERRRRFVYTPDAGAHWKVVPSPAESFINSPLPDLGGPVVRGRGSQIRLGIRAFPFVFALGAGPPFGVYSVALNGSIRQLTGLPFRLIGTNASGTRFLVQELQVSSQATIRTLDLDGTIEAVTAVPYYTPVDGWITPDGIVYLLDSTSGSMSLAYYQSIVRFEVARQLSGQESSLFAVPTVDYSGAWIIQRGAGQPTILSVHRPGAAPLEQWRDSAGPEVEALHAGASGRRVLIQVHRARPEVDQRVFRDPALAVWEVGQLAPADYDELFLNEGLLKQFVHLDVEAVSSGTPFFFDSGSVIDLTVGGVAPSPSGGGGGGDVIQEGGLVRGSFLQRLVLPIVARLPSAVGSAWQTDLVLWNPSDTAVQLTLRYVPTGANGEPREASLILAPRQIRVLTDVLGSLFGITSGSGALFLTPGPDQSIEATSRTFTMGPRGKYGMEVPASEATVSASARFPLTYSAALLGSNFRTQLTATDISGNGEEASLRLSGSLSDGSPEISLTTPPGGQQEIRGLSEAFGLPSADPRALLFAPRNGEVLPALIAVDQRTHDPTYFGPDLSVALTRTIPALVHEDGLNGARWRTDIFLFNPGATEQSLELSADDWNRQGVAKTIDITLQSGEFRRIPDVLLSLFGRTGFARLRCVTQTSVDGIRVTARIYSEDEAGGTVGMRMPPLNSFQSAGSQETLEILMPLDGLHARVNLALVDLGNPDPPTPSGRGRRPGPPGRAVAVEVIGPAGELIASFEAEVPQGGGTELVDFLRDNPLALNIPAVVIRISPTSSLIGAFATLTDNGTNDPAYFGAGLAAK